MHWTTFFVSSRKHCWLVCCCTLAEKQRKVSFPWDKNCYKYSDCCKIITHKEPQKMAGQLTSISGQLYKTWIHWIEFKAYKNKYDIKKS